MLGLTQSVSYSVRAMACLAADGCERGRVEEIATCSGVPAPYLAKLFKRLSDAGLIESRRGRAGGNWLARPATEISLMDIAEAIEGRQWLGHCLLGGCECSDARACPVHDFWRVTRMRIGRELKLVTLADVIAFDLNWREDGGQPSRPSDRDHNVQIYEESSYGSR